jgi:hypothetical protein
MLNMLCRNCSALTRCRQCCDEGSGTEPYSAWTLSRGFA